MNPSLDEVIEALAPVFGTPSMALPGPLRSTFWKHAHGSAGVQEQTSGRVALYVGPVCTRECVIWCECGVEYAFITRDGKMPEGMSTRSRAVPVAFDAVAEWARAAVERMTDR